MFQVNFEYINKLVMKYTSTALKITAVNGH